MSILKRMLKNIIFIIQETRDSKNSRKGLFGVFESTLKGYFNIKIP